MVGSLLRIIMVMVTSVSGRTTTLVHHMRISPQTRKFRKVLLPSRDYAGVFPFVFVQKRWLRAFLLTSSTFYPMALNRKTCHPNYYVHSGTADCLLLVAMWHPISGPHDIAFFKSTLFRESNKLTVRQRFLLRVPVAFYISRYLHSSC